MSHHVFWGLQTTPCTEAGHRTEYSRELEYDTRIAGAALGGACPSAAHDGKVRLFMKVDDMETIVCTLVPKEIPQVYLDIRLESKSMVSFWCTGGYKVHITGYRTVDESSADALDDMFYDPESLLTDGDDSDDGSFDLGEDDSADGSEDEDESDDDTWVTMNNKVVGKLAPKGKIVELPDDDKDESNRKRKAADSSEGKQNKKKKDANTKSASAGAGKDALGDLYAKKKAQEAAAAKAVKAPQPKKEEKPKPTGPPRENRKKGVVVVDTKVGTGKVATRGTKVQMHYTGKLKSTNKVFDSSRGSRPFKFRLGSGEVIAGWDIGVEGMKVGGKRTLHIPAAAGYGRDGAGDDIPPNADLVFDVECLGVQKK